MDTSTPRLFSEIATRIQASYEAEEFAREIAKEFELIGPKNPIRKLSDIDKGRLLVLMSVYRFVCDTPKSSESVERAAQLAAEAGKLAVRFEQELSGPSILGEWQLLVEECRGLRVQLARFSVDVGRLLDTVGKQGHKQKNLSNAALITVSEFVRLKTGTHNDIYLAELFQGKFLGPRHRRVLSGDAIRKKREYLQTRYPVLYDSAQKTALEFDLLSDSSSIDASGTLS